MNSDDHPDLTYNGNQVQEWSPQKHGGLILDNKLSFNKHLDEKINKCNKIIGMLKKFVRPNLDHTYINYDKPHKGSFIEKMKRVQ